MKKPNILYLMCDQYRFDCIAGLGNDIVKTPNLDRLVKRGVSFTNAYSTCPVCVAARNTIRTGREPNHTGCYLNESRSPMDGQPEDMEERCGDYLPRTMKNLGYRTFGIGKFHTMPDQYEELGYEVHIHTEELWKTAENRAKDGYASFIANEHPEFAFIEQPHGERTDMYFQPQMSPLPAHLTVESYVADRTIEQIKAEDDRPYFGFVSFVGPHPPLAPPIPYNRMYNPDAMRNPIHSDPDIDFKDEMILFDRHAIWAEDVNNTQVRALKARYYGEISYIDSCIGRILDEVESTGEADNTMICFFADHGEMMGDHHAWQKANFFEASTRVPYLVSLPGVFQKNVRSDALVCLTDLFALATAAAGEVQTRDGIDIIAGQKREYLAGVYWRPGTSGFKIMIRKDDWKYIFIANGGREQLFNVKNDPNEVSDLSESHIDVKLYLKNLAREYCQQPGLYAALDNGDLREFPFAVQKPIRVLQFSYDQDIKDFEVTCDNNGICMPG